MSTPLYVYAFQCRVTLQNGIRRVVGTPDDQFSPEIFLLNTASPQFDNVRHLRVEVYDDHHGPAGEPPTGQ